ncbi:MAG: SseB family protein [Lachnospiraceae bacterium]|nr:SseB family protein [Lachnospiraceae bacterium]
MTDQGLEGNEKIEEHIGMLKKEPSPEMLAVTLSTIRRRMKQGGQFVVAVSPEKTQKLELRILEHEGKRWLEAYTSFEEEMKGAQPVMSTFLSDIGQVLRMALQSDEVEGLALNPYHRAILLDKHLIRLILGET